MTSKGIKFAPPELGSQFAVEHPVPTKSFTRTLLFTYNSFGFHGDFNPGGMEFIENYNLGVKI